MFKKVCFLVNYNLYESKRHFTVKLCEALNRAGVETDIIDVKESQLKSTSIQRIHSFQPDFTASFNSFEPLEGKQYMWDFLEIPHLSMLVDPSLYSVNLIDSPYSVISCVDQIDCQSIASQGFSRVFFLPHAVEADLLKEERRQPKYDVVFFGTCYDYESMQKSWREELPGPIVKALELAIEIFLSDHVTSLQQALVAAWNKAGVSPQGVNMIQLFYYLDHYTRGYDRVKLIRSIKEAKVHVFGELSRDDSSAVNGWDYYLKDCPNVTIHPAVDFSDSLSILKESKICLNSSPFFKCGTHERMFTGPACGALTISSNNTWIEKTFAEERDIVTYECIARDAVNEKVNFYISHDNERLAIVDEARKKIGDEHTWDQRVLLLQEVMPQLLSQTKATLR